MGGYPSLTVTMMVTVLRAQRRILRPFPDHLQESRPLLDGKSYRGSDRGNKFPVEVVRQVPDEMLGMNVPVVNGEPVIGLDGGILLEARFPRSV